MFMTTSETLQEQVNKIAQEMAPEVVRIRCQLGGTGPTTRNVYFRVVLSDEAASRERLAVVTEHVRERLYRDLALDKEDRIPYFRFRSLSEQAETGEAAWN